MCSMEGPRTPCRAAEGKVVCFAATVYHSAPALQCSTEAFVYQLCSFYAYSKNVTYDSITVRMRNDVREKEDATFGNTGLLARDV